MQVRHVLEELDLARQSIDHASAWLVRCPSTLTFAGPPADVNKTPIRLITENGFEIARLCEANRSIQDSLNECCFAVTSPAGDEALVKVNFGEPFIASARRLRVALEPIADDCPLWLRCAECHLAEFLWEMNRCPERLTIAHLSPDDLSRLICWK